uniref:Putative secreted protein n=1 Tax=Anopheles triannulatus TaxID=58253 RepID=A0A2M4B4Z1_9DIPT
MRSWRRWAIGAGSTTFSSTAVAAACTSGAPHRRMPASCTTRSMAGGSTIGWCRSSFCAWSATSSAFPVRSPDRLA